jgi:hypothetical protein
MKKIHEILTHRKRICKIRIHRMTAPGLAACLVFMAVSLAACQSADPGDRKRTSRLSGNRTAQDRQTRRIMPQKEKTPRTQGHPGGRKLYRIHRIWKPDRRQPRSSRGRTV